MDVARLIWKMHLQTSPCLLFPGLILLKHGKGYLFITNNANWVICGTKNASSALHGKMNYMNANEPVYLAVTNGGNRDVIGSIGDYKYVPSVLISILHP